MSQRKVRLPGLVDIHVHLRDPGQTQKEDFFTGTLAALAGGFTTVVDMPNNSVPVTTVDRLKAKIDLARQKVVGDIGFYFGSLGDNLDQFPEASQLSYGLKLYLNKTTGGYMVDPEVLRKIYKAWPAKSPVLLHAEEDVIDDVMDSLVDLDRPLHICHMPSKQILKRIIDAKKADLPVTCGVTPHHLFLNSDDADRIGVYGHMKPSLKPQEDVDFLWENMEYIDMIESDHAPHTKKEKEEGAFGVPGLETTLSLLLTAESEGRMSLEQIIDKCHTQPLKLLGLSAPDDTTYIEVAMEEYEIDSNKLKTKCGWSPFAGKRVIGRVCKVTLRGEVVYDESNVTTAAPGSGRVLYPVASF